MAGDYDPAAGKREGVNRWGFIRKMRWALEPRPHKIFNGKRQLF
jgi:hypothetical protein